MRRPIPLLDDPGRLVVMSLMILFLCAPLTADEIRPSFLHIKENKAGWYDVTWRVPTYNGRALPLKVHLPETLELIGTPQSNVTSGAVVETSRFRSNDSSLLGRRVFVEGLAQTKSQLFFRIELNDGTVYSTILKPDAAAYVVPIKASKLDVAVEYWKMGTIHILEGTDHLLFVFALLLIVAGVRPLITAITAFTVAHSITLALTTLGVLSLPAAPTEAIISLSIMFLAAEIIHKNRGRLCQTEKSPWIVAFIFGLFHGLGFAGALSEIGIPEHEVPLSLLMFNIGVETGQLLFITVVLLMLALLQRLSLKKIQGRMQFVAYAIGSIAAFWTIQRLSSFVPGI